jgi:uncharacterized Zn finger protein
MVRPCPSCAYATPHRLIAPAVGRKTNRFRCPDCGHMWDLPVGEPNAEPIVIVEGQPSQKP